MPLHLPSLETELEDRIGRDPDWLAGMLWGKPRPGHPEGSVGAHTVAVLANVERFATSPAERRELRLVGLLHDAGKAHVEGRGRDHAQLSRELAERHLDDERLLCVIERHDDAFRLFRRRNERRGPSLDALLFELRQLAATELYLRFVRCDVFTGNKSRAPYHWLEASMGLIGDAE